MLYVWIGVAVLVAIAVGALVSLSICLILRGARSSKSTETNIEAIIGERCVVTERIDNYAGCGQVKVGAQNWSARGSHEDDTFEIGEVLDIVAIEGVKLICKR